MKKLLTTLVAGAVVALSANTTEAFSIAGIDQIDAVVGLNTTDLGNARFNETTGRFYIPVHSDYRIVTGFSALMPIDQQDSTGEDVDPSYEFLIGLEFNAGFLGTVEATSGFSGQSGSSDSSNAIAPLTLRKNFLFAVNENIDLGFTLNILEIGLEDDNLGTGSRGQYVSLFSNIYPVIGGTIRF